MELEFRWNANQGIYYAIRRYGATGEHVFAADPKVMHSEELWVEWAKLVADFLAGKGEKVRDADIKDVIASKFHAEQVNEDGLTEQDANAGGVGGGHEPERAGDDPFIGGDCRPTPWQYSTAPADAESGRSASDGVEPAPADGTGDQHR